MLAEKIIKLRKNRGLSQEELAKKISVNKKVVSNWEKGRITPNTKKIVELSEIFDVTTDYLLKDEVNNKENNKNLNAEELNIFEANKFIKWRKKASVIIAIATFLCIVSVIPLIILVELAQNNIFKIDNEFALGMGLGLMSFFIIISVVMFIFCEIKNSTYLYINQGMFKIEYDVEEILKNKKVKYIYKYKKYNIIAEIICILSILPLLAAVFIQNNILKVIMLSFTIFIIAVAIVFFIITGVRISSIKRLLKE